MDEHVYKCLNCGRRITKEECEIHDGLCPECYELEMAELNMNLEDD